MRAGTPQQAPAEASAEEVAEEAGTAEEGAAESSSSSSSSPAGSERGLVSDGGSSSQSSLAARVARLLQSESPATMVSSRTSASDLEESKAREWIKLKVSGQRCQPLELDVEDRLRIEEIKRELLLNTKHTSKSQGSTDTESSVVSSLDGPGGRPPSQPAEPFTALRAAEDRLSRQLQSLSRNPFDSSVLLRGAPLRLDLEAQVREIAQREGLSLPGPRPPPLTSITIATCRRSRSPSPLPSSLATPEPLRLDQLSAGGPAAQGRLSPSPRAQEEDAATLTSEYPTSTSEPNSSLNAQNQNQDSVDSRSEPGIQPGHDALRSRCDPPRSQGSQTEVVDTRPDVRPDSRPEAPTQQTRDREEAGPGDPLPPTPGGDGRISRSYPDAGPGHGADGASGSATTNLPVQTGHVSRVHLTLSPKATDHALASGPVPGFPTPADFAPLRRSSPVAGGLDEGLGHARRPTLSNQERSQQTTEPLRRPTQFTAAVPEGKMTSKYPQAFTPPPRLTGASRPLTILTPALPVLLPYKPHGSEELFYMPQADAQISSIRSDSTMESSHPGSDDAVPPRFSVEILGSRDQEENCGVTIKHAEGIYSKRRKDAGGLDMQAARTGSTESVDRGSQASEGRSPKPFSQREEALARASLPGPAAPTRDQGTDVPDSPGRRSPGFRPPEDGEEFQPLRGEMDHSTDDRRARSSTLPRGVVARDLDPARRDPGLTKPRPQRRADSALDQLWRRFIERRSQEEPRPAPGEGETTLLERLERLSRLIHSNGASPPASPDKTAVDERDPAGREPGGRREEEEAQTDGRRQAWPQQDTRAEKEASSASPGQHRCPAERDESGETTSSCVSTVDTARLVRAFGAHRVRGLKTGSGRGGLGKLYGAIGKQREGKEQRRGKGRVKDTPPTVLSETTITDDSFVTADSTSSTCTYSLPPGRGPAQPGPAKRPVRLVSKGIQTGDLEIVINGTRRHTRDVGTTFPSPGSPRVSGRPSSSSSSSTLSNGERAWGVERSPPKAQVFLRQRKSKSKRSQTKRYPQGVSWFVPADDLRAESRKENQPEGAKPGLVWFEPYRRTRPWREPLRVRQAWEERDQTSRPVLITEPEPEPKPSSPLVRITLQEALELRRPGFVSGSRERLKRLALKVEERKLEAVFNRERDELFNRPGGPGRLPKPAGTALFKRAVPKKEMVLRSKQRSGLGGRDCSGDRVDRRTRQERWVTSDEERWPGRTRQERMYAQLPEVQKRREEERRKAEYRSYRLNAQLYNKKITNRVLGKQTPWQ